MRKLIGLFLIALLAGCGSDGGNTVPQDPVGETGECSNDGQKQFVLDNLYAWYLWNDLLPADIDIADYASPEELVVRVTEDFGPQKPDGGPLDRFSSVGSLVADQQFYGEGKYEGFGFSWRFEGADLRFSRVFVDSPANAAGFSRGQTVLRLNGRTIADINANEGISDALNFDTVEFEIQNLDASTFTVSVTKDIVTIDPIPQYRIIDMGAGNPPVGYMEFATFISTADPEFYTIFSEFIAAGVEDVIIDMRHNGGGLVSTANLLGDYLGGFANDGQIFSNTEFNADRAAANNSIDYLARRGSSIDINRLIVVASRGTASASELVINGLDPFVTGGVYIIGDSTFGKPVGQIGLEFCEKILRPTSFKKSNAAGFGDYFDGLPVDCVATDDLDFAIGADDDPNMIAAMSVVNTDSCPAVAATEGQFAPQFKPTYAKPDRRGPPHRELLDAY